MGQICRVGKNRWAGLGRWITRMAGIGWVCVGLTGCEVPDDDPESRSEALVQSTEQALAVGAVSVSPVSVSKVTAKDLNPARLCLRRNVDIDRSIVVTDPEILARFPLRDVLDQIVDLAPTNISTADTLFEQWWATQRERTTGEPTRRPRCGDDGSTINGFPIACPRAEHALEDHPPETHFPVALFNRFDLAPLDGAHCGEYRIVYAKHTVGNGGGVGGRNFVIFEGVLPNPNPDCGLAACRRVADFWADLTDIDDVETRADALESFYFEGLSGFEPVIHPEHYGLPGLSSPSADPAPTGQIRTNQFVQSPWLLREYQIARRCFVPRLIAQRTLSRNLEPVFVRQQCELIMKPVTVKNNPFPGLWSSAHPLFAGYEAAFLDQLSLLIPDPDNINKIGMFTEEAHNGGESAAQFGSPNTANYNPDAVFADSIEQTLDDLGSPGVPPFDADDIAVRAETQSCGGCHQLAGGQNLGNGLSWPAKSPSFVHVDEDSVLSNALMMPGGFLEHREDVLERFLSLTCAVICLAEPLVRTVDGSLQLSTQASPIDPVGPVTQVRGTNETLGGSVTH